MGSAQSVRRALALLVWAGLRGPRAEARCACARTRAGSKKAAPAAVPGDGGGVWSLARPGMDRGVSDLVDPGRIRVEEAGGELPSSGGGGSVERKEREIG